MTSRTITAITGVRPPDNQLVNRAPITDAEAGQLLMSGFNGTRPGDAGVEEIRTLISQGRVGSIILMGNNIVSPEQLRRLTQHLQSAAPPNSPLLIAVDQEGGAVQRLSANKGFAGFPSAAQMTQIAARDMAQAEQIYRNMARELRANGINMNLGPVVDMSSANQYMGRTGRSFGTDPDLVARMGEAFIRAHRQEGVLSVLKHYPGHGTAADTHVGPGNIEASWNPNELEPYRRLASQAGGVMMSHTTHSRFSDNGLPATLSQRAFQSLRRDVGFRGVAISDGMEMEALRRVGPYRELLPAMVRAGNNMVILPTDHSQRTGFSPREAHQTLMQAAVQSPDIARQIRASAQMVRELKDQLRQEPLQAQQRPAITPRSG